MPNESSWTETNCGQEEGIYKQFRERSFLGKDWRRGKLVITKYEMYALCNDSGAFASLYSAVWEIV